MFCPTCGVALATQLKYCNRCGAHLMPRDQADEIEASEKSLRDEMVDLFWATVIGLGLILGGMALIKNAMHLSDWILVVYLIISSTAFTVNFGLGLWQIRRFARLVQEARAGLGPGSLSIEQLNSEKAKATLNPSPSVTESTTRSLDLRSKEELTD
ncbi:MAG TPA: hypothetical protein VNO50_05740 [Pyrinomonadaceae bacterium]|nr:hypothetical protein [Pyrinomonadaceae bacterium]